MNAITAKEVKSLLNLPGQPCVSLYQPTQPGGGEKDPIQWKNLLTDASNRLEESGMAEKAVKRLLRPATHVLEDSEFWKQSGEALAYFLTPEEQRCYRPRQAFGPSVTVGARFFIKPLLAALDSESRFYVLDLNQKRIHLWEGDSVGLREVELKTMPTSLAEALRFHDRDEPLEYHTQKVGGHWSAIFHGQGVGIDTVKDDLLLYFQKIDRGLHDYLPEKAPLILASVEYLWPIYRKANRHPHLLEKGLAGNPQQWSERELHDRAWGLVHERFEAPRRQACAQFAALAGTGRTCHEPQEVIRAALEGRLETLFVPLDREAWGTVNEASGEFSIHPQRMKGDEDLLNVAAIKASEHGAKVFVLPIKDMPQGGVTAGIYWLPAAKHA
jgi:Bacterial archaeo-eukaryotic release factor family 7